MDDFRVFDSFRVCAWMSKGILNAVEQSAQSIRSMAKRTGATALVSIAAVSATISLSPAAHASNMMQTVVHVIPADQSAFTVGANHSLAPQPPGYDLAAMSVEIEKHFQNRHSVDSATVAPQLFARAELALERIKASGMVFSADWAERVAHGKA